MPLLVLALVSACTHERAAARDYTLNGIVRQLPDPRDPATSFYLEHEAIDTFVDRDGKVSGMDSMTMPFDLATGISLHDIAVGDPVAVTLHVDWSADRPVEVTRVVELPPDTKLQFRAARPPRS